MGRPTKEIDPTASPAMQALADELRALCGRIEHGSLDDLAKKIKSSKTT